MVFLAEGFGSGRLRPGPGTWGSVVGVGWFFVLVGSRSLTLYVLGALLATVVAVWACGVAERALGRTDPGSVVLDEIVAIPWCFLPPLVAHVQARGGRFPGIVELVGDWPWWVVPAGFAAFRLFDIFKPWPIRQLQRLPGGWGIVVDDLAAAVWVAALAGFVAA